MNKGWVCETCDKEAEYLPVVSHEQIRSWAAEHAAAHRGHVVKLFREVEEFCQPPDTESQKLADTSELQRLVSEAVMRERVRCLRFVHAELRRGDEDAWKSIYSSLNSGEGQ